MFRQFVAGAVVGAVLVALATLGLICMPGLELTRTWLLTTIWCLVPLVWGVWAMLTPCAWLPERLPYWGAILGFIAGVMSGFVLNMPHRIFEVSLSTTGHIVVALFGAVLYYFLWMLVGVAYRSLAPIEPAPERLVAESDARKAA